VTKKGIKQELERRFNVNLDAKRAYIGSGKSPQTALQPLYVLTISQLPKPSYLVNYETCSRLSVGVVRMII